MMNHHQVFNNRHLLFKDSYYLSLMLYQKHCHKVASSSKNSWKIFLVSTVSDNFKSIELSWVRISRTNEKTGYQSEQVVITRD